MAWLIGKICVVFVKNYYDIRIHYLLAYRFSGYLITNVPDVSIRDVVIVSK